MNYPAKITCNFPKNWHLSLSNLPRIEVLPVCKCQKSIILDFGYFEMCHFQVILRENSNVISVDTKGNLTFKHISPLTWSSSGFILNFFISGPSSENDFLFSLEVLPFSSSGLNSGSSAGGSKSSLERPILLVCTLILKYKPNEDMSILPKMKENHLLSLDNVKITKIHSHFFDKCFVKAKYFFYWKVDFAKFCLSEWIFCLSILWLWQKCTM